jgi:hypothetical protein
MSRWTFFISTVLVLQAGASQAQDVPGPVAHYRFDDESPAAVDSSGNSNTGVFVSGAKYQGGSSVAPTRCNVDSLQLNGSGHISIANSPSLSFPGSFSVATWASLDATKPEINLVSKDTTSWYTNYNLHVWNNRAALAVTFDQAVSVGPVSLGHAWCDSGGCALQGASAFVDEGHPLGSWRHVAAVYDDSAKKITVYVDGVKDGEVTFVTTGKPRVNDATLQLGRRKSTSTGAMAGRLDDVQLFGSALRPDQVKAVYRCPERCGCW